MMEKLIPSLFLIVSSHAIAGDICCEDPCTPCIDACCGEFYIEGSFLYWNAGLNDMYYALHSTTDQSDTILPKDVFSKADLREPGYSWDPGVRATIGWRECDCGWDFELTGTYFKTHSIDGITGPIPDFSAGILEFVTPILNPSFSGNFIASPTSEGFAEAKWDLTFGTIDALGAGHFSPWNCIKLRPNFGLRTAWINQRLKAEYAPISFFLFPSFTVISGDSSISKYKNEYWGIGFKGGLDFEANLCSNFNVIGGFGGSLLFGKLKNNSEIIGHTVDPGAPEVLNNIENTISEKFNKLASDLEAEMGLAYSCNWGCFGFNLSVSYFFSIWFDQSEFRNFFFTSSSVSSPQVFLNSQNLEKLYSNLVMHGIQVGLELSF